MNKRIWVLWVGAALVASSCGDEGLFGDDRFCGNGGGGAECDGFDAAAASLDEEEQRFLELLNQHRQANGVPPVSACASLNRAAQAHSEDMRDQD